MNRIHAFAICAYGESPYLEECIRSLKSQSEPSDLMICTSTPGPYLTSLASAHGIPLFVRDGESGIREDWQFAWKIAGRDHALVTIAHQDDRYHRDYTKRLLHWYSRYPDMTVFASDYVVLKTKEGRTKDGRFYPVCTKVKTADLSRFIKKALRLLLRVKPLAGIRAVKRSALIFGNSICCPSCTYNHDRIGDEMFLSDYTFALDWENLYELAGKPGRFVIEERPLIAYRVHDGATTKQCIDDQRRAADETAMFRKIWPEWIVRPLMHFYRKAYGAYGEES